MQWCVLGSGSAGNALLVEDGEGARLVIDAGLSVTRTRTRAAALGISLDRADAIVITHEHGDHITHAGPLSRGLDAPQLLTEGTREGGLGRGIRGDEPWERVTAGATVQVGQLEVEILAKPHDAQEPIALLVRHEDRCLGFFSDLGHFDEELRRAMGRCTTVFLEANHDPGLLSAGPYPPALRRRVGGAYGHISNDDAARALRDSGAELDLLVLGHVSTKNNTFGHVRESFQRLTGARADYPRWISRQDAPTPLFDGHGRVLRKAEPVSERRSASA